MRIPRAHAAIFALGFFGLGFVPMMTVAVPLWALDIGATPLMIGLVLGARAALSVVLSIPGGALMDRLGINRIAAAAAVATAALFPLYPALPSVAVLIVLQLLTGFAQALVWMAAQAHVGRINRDDPGLMGRFSFVSTSGNLVAPVLCGMAWDAFGPIGAFSLIGAWGLATLMVIGFLPRDVRRDDTPEEGRARRSWIGDYRDALGMMAAPAVAFVVACSFLMTCVHALRHSFYPVYLESLDFGGATIGVLVAVGSVVAGLSGLTAGPISRRVRPNILLVATVGTAAALLSSVVLFHEFWQLLGIATGWGVASGIAFPLMLYVLARSVNAERQGMSVGIRSTVNRFAGFVVPVAIGAAVEGFGLEIAFFGFGAVMLTALGLIALRLMPEVGRG
ncbi:MAG: MFS transporter [Defluviicoccus sp.]|nr:MFS transporter [Defluviicoccus sp.]MDE0383484.1 MFS transporter [Defluviicoccus sp.]